MTQKSILNPLVGTALVSLLITFPSEAQVKHDLTLTHNSSIKIEGNQITIDGGTQVGKNLFHSFQEFSLSKGDIATFTNALDIANILVRVTGASASNIDGIINANGTANVFFSNPNGISFGENARLNIGGSFLATTASAFIFPNGSEFSAINPQAPTLLAINVPIGLRFRSNPGEIKVNGTGKGLITPSTGTSGIVANSNITGLQVQAGNSLSLIGGNVTIKGGTLKAEGGTINIGSVGSGVVSLSFIPQGLNLGYEGVYSLKDITLSQQALVDTSGDPGGSITLEGKNIFSRDGSAILIQNQNSPSGNISIKASESLELNGTSQDGRFITLLRTESLGSGIGGNVDIFAKKLLIQRGATLGARSYSIGKGGDIRVNTSDSIELFGFSSFNPFFTSNIVASTLGSGNAGNITITTDHLVAKDGGLIASLTRSNGAGGNVLLNANSIELLNSPDLIKSGQDFVNYIPSYFAAQSFNAGNAGYLIINTEKLVVGEKATVNTSSTGGGSAGSLTINASDIKVNGTVSSAVVIAGLPTQRELGSPSVVTGLPGELTINTKHLDITGGLVSVRNLGTSDGGSLTIKADSLNLDNKASIAASTASGEGGNISLEARNVQLRHNSLLTATAQSGQGNGGNINIESGTVALLEDSGITANAFEGRGGNINIDTQGLFVSPNSSITASSAKGVNGVVTVHTGQMNFVNTVGLKIGFNNTDTTKFCADSESREQFAIAGSGGIPTSPSDPFNSLDGWSDDRKPNTNTTQSETNTSSTQNLVAPEYIEAQGSISNNDGTISFTDVPSDTTPYSSLSSAPCHSSEQSLAPGQQLSGEIIPEPPQKSTEH